MGVGLGDAEGGGVLVAQVFPDTPAGNAGLKAGDLVMQLNGEAVTESRALVRAIGMMPPGEVVKLIVQRGGATQELSVTLAERPPEPSLTRAPGGR
jgi:serine protease Do